MCDKIINSKKVLVKKTPPEIIILIEKKFMFFQDVIQKTILHIQKNKILEIISASDVNSCINTLFELSKKIKDTSDDSIKSNTDNIINILQQVNNELSSLFKLFGTASFEDLLWICFGNNSVNTYAISDMDKDKFELLKKYFHPTSYKLLGLKKSDDKLLNNDNNHLNEKSQNLDTVDIDIKIKQFHLKVHGIQLFVHNPHHKKSIIITGTVDDIMIDFLNNKYVNLKYQAIKKNLPHSKDFQGDMFIRCIQSLNLKDYLISEPHDIYSKYVGYLSNLNTLRQKNITQIIKEFVDSELFMKRNIIIQLLVKIDKYDNQYLAYLLYDLLSNDTNGTIDTQEQIKLFDSFPWTIKQYFKDAMKTTVQYTNDLSNFDIQKIPLEQQICLLKVSDSVKEKAIQKLKEIKSKSEDSGSKARQYLEGLLKIPFNIYRREPVLNIMNDIKLKFTNMLQLNNITNTLIKDNYTSLEMVTLLKGIKYNLNKEIDILNLVNEKLEILSCYELKIIVTKINCLIISNKIEYKKLKINRNMGERRNDISEFVQSIKNNKKLLLELFDIKLENELVLNSNKELLVHSNEIETKYKEINRYIANVKTTLDNAVHGHDEAKKQIERIIGQWINGKQDGYCFGFEGPAGVGKCFAKNTPIMLFNGEIKMVQDITINDKLMGDDSTIRNIVALGSGCEKMYRIKQIKGDDYIVNESHILSLKVIAYWKKQDKYQTILGKKYYKNDIIDICINDYLSLPKYIKKCLNGYKIGIDFNEKTVSIEPYDLGCWIGYGSLSKFTITTVDKKIIDYFYEFAKKYNLFVRQGTGKSNITYTYSLTTLKNDGKKDKNILVNKLREYNLIYNKHIPNIYKCNSREVRLKLLAGLIDTYGYYNKDNNSLELSQKNKILAQDILWIVRSLGFRGIMKENTKLFIYKGEKKHVKYFRIIITGKGLEKIPILLERKQPKEHTQVKNSLNTRIEVILLEEDTYYGFQIDGNSRFLLGDFTVTHNTTLAKKGLADCLKDENGIPRPFAMIQMGGDANGSSLHGHNYTYVGSTWGSIVQILIDKKCMNPIIFIDEIDKISKTEHGKEIVGILTHLLDPSQNDCFQDKYFSGIDLDLSKALFILSYNHVDAIDKIMLDRVHRVKFKNLTLEEKLVISTIHILPEVYDKMGLQGMITFSNEVLRFIIEEYTLESGVRKLKEILFEIVSEINLDILKNIDTSYNIPINVTIDDIKQKYFKNKQETLIRKVSDKNEIGFINGMYATTLGTGGTLPIHAKYFPSDKFLDLKLTGLQQDVMRESMHVSLTVAWNLTSLERQITLRQKYDIEPNKCGINIHTGDNAVAKDGPSGGCAITCALYSLLNNIPIKPEFGITGEIQMSGEVTAIGGLNYKILGSMKSNVKSFIFPKENEKDFKEFLEKYKDTDILNGVNFYPISNVKEAFNLILETNNN
jgi:hypothetical protein